MFSVYYVCIYVVTSHVPVIRYRLEPHTPYITYRLRVGNRQAEGTDRRQLVITRMIVYYACENFVPYKVYCHYSL